ncbi:unnamed protein product, partial [Brachionus calyciflorus]
TIHKVLKLDTIEERANKLFIKFLTTKSNHELIANDINQFVESQTDNPKGFKTLYSTILNKVNENIHNV